MTQTPKEKLEALGTELIRGYDSFESWKKALLEDPIKMMKAVGFDTYDISNEALQIFFMDNQPILQEAFDEVNVRGTFGCNACKIGILIIAIGIIALLAAAGIDTVAALLASSATLAASLEPWALRLGMTSTQLIASMDHLVEITLAGLLGAICSYLGYCS